MFQSFTDFEKDAFISSFDQAKRMCEKKDFEELNEDQKEALQEKDEDKLDDFAGQVQSAIDLIWDEHDADKSGFLDKKETEEFVKHTL